MRRWPSVDIKLGNRLRHWHNIIPALTQHLAFAEIVNPDTNILSCDGTNYVSELLNDIEAALESGGFRGVSMSEIIIRTLLYADDLLLMSDLTEDPSSALISCMTTAHGGN